MLVSERNPIVWVVEVVAAMQQGWKLKPEISAGHPSCAFLFEIELYKGFSVDYTACKEETFHVEEYDTLKYLQACQEAVLNGFVINEKSIWFDSVGIKRAVFTNPNYVIPTIYNKEQLENMEYEDLKKVGKQMDCFNRARDIMIVKILEKQKEI